MVECSDREALRRQALPHPPGPAATHTWLVRVPEGGSGPWHQGGAFCAVAVRAQATEGVTTLALPLGGGAAWVAPKPGPIDPKPRTPNPNS